MADDGRPVGLPLMVGLVAVPAVFIWFLLLPGYARSTRRAAFAYLLIPPGLAVATTMLSALLR